MLCTIEYSLLIHLFVYFMCFFNYSNFHNIFMTNCNCNFMIFVIVTIFQDLKAKIHWHFQSAIEGFITYLFMGIGPCPQPFISADWYMGLLWGCCCIMGFWGPPIRPDIILVGGLLPVPTNEGSPCWPIPGITTQRHL